jgi:hypothetical protein
MQGVPYPYALSRPQGMPNVHPACISQDANSAPPSYGLGQFGAFPVPQSPQSGNIKRRNNEVREQFWQITPHDYSAADSSRAPAGNRPSEPQETKEKDAAKLVRAQRARYALNVRPSKSKKVTTESDQDGISDAGQVVSNDGKNIAKQREKNRVAAAKCRAKKKNHDKDLKEESRRRASVNNNLKLEERHLKEKRGILRTHLLQHQPGRCKCTAIHNFNMIAAQNFALGLGVKVSQPTSSVSQESVRTTGSEAFVGRKFSILDSGAT